MGAFCGGLTSGTVEFSIRHTNSVGAFGYIPRALMIPCGGLPGKTDIIAVSLTRGQVPEEWVGTDTTAVG